MLPCNAPIMSEIIFKVREDEVDGGYVAIALGAAGLFGVFVMLVLDPSGKSLLGTLAIQAFSCFFLGVFLSQFAANWLVGQKPRR